MSMNIVKSGLVFGLLLSIGAYAEEPQKPEEATEVTQEAAEINTDEEATNRIFDEWYEGKIIETFYFFEGHIKEFKEKYIVYLETIVPNAEKSNSLFIEKNTISFFLSRNLEKAKDKFISKDSEWAFLDKNTKCTYIWKNKIPVQIQCISCFEKKDFVKRLQKKEQEKYSKV